MRKFCLLWGLLIILPSAYTQTAHPLTGTHIAVPSPAFPASWYPQDSGTYTSAPIAGAPYRGTVTISTEMTGPPDSPPIITREIENVWRDSAGRVWSETAPSEVGRARNDVPLPQIGQIHVSDPVQHCQFNWYVSALKKESKIATVSCSSLTEFRSDDSWAKKMLASKEEKVHTVLADRSEDTLTTPLGRRTIEGLQAIGLRLIDTETNKEGQTKQTKEREIWWSPDLYINLLAIVKTPAHSMTERTTIISREEPSVSLFYPPDGYRIKK